eukprot:11174277-Lingulodinium_polyedra.AAC.1
MPRRIMRSSMLMEISHASPCSVSTSPSNAIPKIPPAAPNVNVRLANIPRWTSCVLARRMPIRL